MDREKIGEKLKKIEIEAQTASVDKKTILRKWWSFYKHKLDKIEQNETTP